MRSDVVRTEHYEGAAGDAMRCSPHRSLMQRTALMNAEPVTPPSSSRRDRRTFLVITVVIVAVLGGVAVNNYATNQQTLDSLAAARSDVAELEQDKETLSSALDGVTTERDELVALLDDATGQLDDTTTQLADAHAENAALVEERDDALAAQEAAVAQTVALRE